MEHILISGFADEISPDFDEQLRVVTSLGMEYVSLRTADGKGIADYTCLLYTSPSPRDGLLSRMPSSA